MSDVETGPDRVLSTENLTSWSKDGCVKIRKTKDWPANRDTISLPTLVNIKKDLLKNPVVWTKSFWIV